MAVKTINKVLMVDDDADIRKICHLSLTAVGKWQVVLPDVILLDVMMPGMDGITAFNKLREIPALANTPVILITAKVQQHELEKYMVLGIAGVIMKPFDPMELPNLVLRLLGQDTN
jgi:CheY-like chemotaxis protein